MSELIVPMQLVSMALRGRTISDFDPGENMCRDVPIEVRAQLRNLQRSEEPVVQAMVLQSL